MQTGLVLYIRQGCHLCDAFMDELRQFNISLFDSVTLVDVDENASHCQQFGDKVPILFDGDIEICRYFFDANKIESCLKL